MIDGLTIHRRDFPERKADMRPFPQGLSKELCDYLKKQGIDALYCHQAEMFERAVKHENLVITTSTASGKTLSFLLPIVDAILKEPQTRAILLYPTKALAADQLRAIRPFLDYFGEGRINAGVYDGDTPVEERSRIRKRANIILTNPEMLNGSFLPNHSRYGFDFIFSNLRFIVLDELHTYRGIFGSHIANVLRRLNRICNNYKAAPLFLCSSATIKNPKELAEELTGKEFTKIDRDGSPSASKSYYIIQPPRIVDDHTHFEGQVRAVTVASELIPQFVENEKSFICFTKSRRDVELVLRQSRDKLTNAAFLGHSWADKISGYRGGYTPLERRRIEKDMLSGRLTGLVSTNALELGIDIGSVEATILVGYPGTRASFWQRCGRAGRKGSHADNYLILESLPDDQYIGVSPDWLFDSENENAIIDKDNLMIELAHIRAAAAELPLTLKDLNTFPDLGEAIPVLLRIGELKSCNGRFLWSGNAFPAGDYSLRNMEKIRYKLINEKKHVQITEMDELQAYRELHEGAIYLHDGNQYQVIRMDRESHTCFCIPFEGNYYTMPGARCEVRVLKEQENKPFFKTDAGWGDVNVTDEIFMYKKLQFHNHQNLGYEELSEVLSKTYDTESCFIRIPVEVRDVYRSLLRPSPDGYMENNNNFTGMLHAIGAACRMVTMTEKEDMGFTMSNNALDMPRTEGEDVFLFLYDKFVGGLGYAQKAYELLPDILSAAIRLVEGCPCKDGCAACTGDYKLDKRAVLWGLKSLRESLPVPEGFKYVTYAPRPQLKKPFVFLKLMEDYDAFLAYLKKSGDDLYPFFEAVREITITEQSITFHVKDAFTADWIMEPINKKSIRNLLHTVSDMGSNVKILAKAEEKGNRNRIKDKLNKRYDKWLEDQKKND